MQAEIHDSIYAALVCRAAPGTSATLVAQAGGGSASIEAVVASLVATMEASGNTAAIAALYGLIGRGVRSATVDETGHLILMMTDGDTIDVGDVTGEYTLPTATAEILGGVKIGANLAIEDGVLSVLTADDAEPDNTRPITSAAVHTELGNIEVLLAAI